MGPQDELERDVQPSERKQYTSPQLIEYGTVQDLTRGGGGTDFDSQTGNNSFLGLI